MIASSVTYGVLAAALFIGTFGIDGILVLIVATGCFLTGVVYVTYVKGKKKSDELKLELKNILKSYKFFRGHQQLLKRRCDEKEQYTEVHSMSNDPAMDQVLEQILDFVMRDYIASWYKNITNSNGFEQSLRRTTRRSVASLTQCMRQVDWVPFFTRDVVDDFASHLRLYRKAKERFEFVNKDGKKSNSEDLLSHFFDFELEMEKTLCRDLLSTTPHYENAYLHDLVDIILYLIMPPEDFRSRPLRFLIREVIVRKIIVPTLDYLSDPHTIFDLIVWLLSEVEPRPEDFLACIERSKSVDELEAFFESLAEEKTVMRGKDAGGDQDVFVKQQIASLTYVENLIKKKMELLTDGDVGVTSLSVLRTQTDNDNEQLVKLPIHVVLTNTVAISFFIDHLKTVGGQNFIDCYLAIEGFKVSMEHQMRSLASGELLNTDAYETLKEAAQFMYQQYLSQEAITRVALDDSLVSKFLARLRNDDSPDTWFEAIQERITEVLKTDENFYPQFRQSPLYLKMLAELGIIDEEERRSETPFSDSESSISAVSMERATQEMKLPTASREDDDAGAKTMEAIVEALGIGQQGKNSFALYNVRVTRAVNGKKVSSWNVLRRYSDFHSLNAIINQKYPKMSNLAFPGKKTFNNLDSQFLEKRTKALNQYMECILHPNFLSQYPDLEKIVFDFLSQKEYSAKAPLAKKMMSAMFDPIKTGVKAVGSTVMSMPDQVFDGVTKVGAGINNAAKIIINPYGNQPSVAPTMETDRVAASLSDLEAENIPLRVMVLFVDEVFGVRGRNAWFRRQMVMVLRQFVTPFGTSINKKIIDLVNWLTSQQQVTSYLNAFRDSMWPNGQLAPELPPKSRMQHERARVLAKTLMISSMPEELRLVLGSETSYQGINTIAEAFQDKNLNRRLLYVLLERLLITVFPQNRFQKIFAQLHSKSPRTKKI